MNRSLVSLIFLLLFSACSQNKNTSAQLRVTSTFAVGAAGFTGGLVVWGSNGTQTFTTTAVSGTSVRLTLAIGDWRFRVVGWDGAAPFQGDVLCGATAAPISGEAATVDLNISSANCESAPFSTPLLNSKVKPLRVYTCSQLLDDFNSPVTPSTLPNNLTNFCPSPREFSKSMRLTLKGSLGFSSIVGPCISTPSPSTVVGQIPYLGFPLEIELFNAAGDCPGSPSYVYRMPGGIGQSLSDGVILNSMNPSENSLFLFFPGSVVPLTATLNTKAGQLDPTASPTVNFTAVFSRAIDPNTFTGADLENTGTAVISGWTITNGGDNRTFTVSASALTTGYGTVIPRIKALSVSDQGGALNPLASTSSNVVRYLQSRPLSPTSGTFIGGISGQKSEAIIFRFNNNTGRSLNNCVATLTGTGASDLEKISGRDSCTVSTLPSGVTCEVHVNVKSTASVAPTKTAGLDVLCDTAMARTTTASSISFSVTTGLKWASVHQTLNTGTVSVGLKSAPIKVFFRNESLNPYTCTAPAVSDPTNFTIQHDCLVDQLTPALSRCTVTLVAAPLAAGALTTTVSRTCDGVTITSPPFYATGVASWPTKIRAAGHGTCAVMADGTLNCWGENLNGSYLGLAVAQPLATKVNVSGIVSVSRGSASTCAVKNDGTVICWGNGALGQLGDGLNTANTNTLPVVVAGINNATALTSGINFHCALLSDNTVKCWGMNTYGFFGNGVKIDNNTLPQPGPSGTFTQISAAGESVCGIRPSKEVMCWGRGTYGQLGNDFFSDSASPVSTGITNAVQLASGGNFHCALLDSKTVKCWGENSKGSLGDGTFINNPVPQPVLNLSNVLKLSQGFGLKGFVLGEQTQHMCALIDDTDKTVKCWGRNNYGQLGNSTFLGFTGLVNVEIAPQQPLKNVTDLTHGNDHTCALRTDKSIYCWGRNRESQLGRSYENDGTPVPIKKGGVPVLAKEVAMAKNLTCTLGVDDKVFCWGNNSPALGLGANVTYAPEPTDLGFSNILDLSVGGGNVWTSACARDLTSVRCWGSNASGELGNGSTTPISSALPISSDGWTQPSTIGLSAGGKSRCVLLDGGSAKCAGDYGVPGGGSAIVDRPLVDSALSITKLSGSYWVNFALADNKTVWAFGGNGQAGFSPTGQPSSQLTNWTQIPNLSNINQIAGFRFWGCAIDVYGKLSCWGQQGPTLGSNQAVIENASNPPSQLYSLDHRTIIQVTGGNSHACALDHQGVVWCWGTNGFGQLGLGELLGGSGIPKPVLGLPPVAKLWKPDGDAEHSCAIAASGNAVWCWGRHQLFAPNLSLAPAAVSGFSD